MTEPITDDQLAELITYKQAWLADAKAIDATWPEGLQGGFENIEANLAALLELQERRKESWLRAHLDNLSAALELMDRGSRLMARNLISEMVQSIGARLKTRCVQAKYGSED